MSGPLPGPAVVVKRGLAAGRWRVVLGLVGLVSMFGVTLVLATGAIGESDTLVPPDVLVQRRGADLPSPPDGPSLFVGNCATCHGNHNIGQDNASENASIILRGIGDRPNGVIMPSFADFLTDDEIATLATYMAQQAGDPRSQITAAQVAQLRARL